MHCKSFKMYILMSSVFVISVFFFLFATKNLFAMDNSQINMWKWEEKVDDKGNVISLSLTEYSVDDQEHCDDIVVPNVFDFQSSDVVKYKNLKEICIDKSVMNSIAKKVGKYNGTLKISDASNGNVIASDEDWSNCFNFEGNNMKEIDLSHLDTKNINNMEGMFANCKNLQALNLSNVDTKNVYNMKNMFTGCKNLRKLDLSGFDTKNVEDMNNIFVGSGIKIIDLSGFVFKDGANIENMFDEVSENRLLILSNEQNCDVLTELTENRDAMNLKFVFGEKSFHAFDGVVFCPSSIDISRETDENFDDYLNRIIEKYLEMAEQVMKEHGLCSQDSVITWQPENDYKTIEEKLSGVYRGAVTTPAVKPELVEGTDFRWPEAISDLKYDGQPKKLVGDGFINSDKKSEGVKFEYSKDKISWIDKIPVETEIGIYKIYLRINGGEKYQDVYFVDKDGNDYLKIEIIKDEEEIKKLSLVEGTDFRWPEAISDLKYDGQPKKLVGSGFINPDKKSEGVKFEYSKDKINWIDKIPVETEIGIYKIYLRINGGEKYQDVYFVDKDGNDYLKIKIYALELQDGVDYRFAQAKDNLTYDAREKELLHGGFVSENIKNDGVKIEYSKDGIRWSDKIPTGIKAGVYKIYQKINGGKKYKDVFYNLDGKRYIEVKISDIKKKSDTISWRTIESGSSGSSESSEININSLDRKQINSDRTLKKINLPERFKVQKYLSGYPNGQIKPYNDMTHAEFVSMIYKLMYDGKEKINTDKMKNLTDVKIADWYGICVAYLLDKDIINMENNKFRPNENITRGEVAEIWFNVLKFYDTEKSKKYDYGSAFYNFTDADKFGKFAEPIKQLASNGIINGYEDKTFRANKNITRAEVAKIVFYASGRKNNLGQKIYSDLNKNYWAYKFLMDASA